MREQPTAIELIQSVSDFLRDDALPKLDGLTAFHARVAVSVLEMVQRELELGPQADSDERAILAGLLGHSGERGLEELNQALCRQIVNGAMGPATPGLVQALLDVALRKLAVDQPTYSTYKRLVAARTSE